MRTIIITLIALVSTTSAALGDQAEAVCAPEGGN